MTAALLAEAALWVVTAFAPGCGATGLTRAGTTPVAGHVVAADPSALPLGSIVDIEGHGLRQVQDAGPLVRGQHVDVFVGSCAEARAIGRSLRRVRVLHLAARAGRPRG